MNTFLYLLTVVNCGTLTDPANGQVSYTAGTVFGQRATYSCDMLATTWWETALVYVRATGVWSGSAPTCQGMLLLELEYYACIHSHCLSIYQVKKHPKVQKLMIICSD